MLHALERPAYFRKLGWISFSLITPFILSGTQQLYSQEKRRQQQNCKLESRPSLPHCHRDIKWLIAVARIKMKENWRKY